MIHVIMWLIFLLNQYKNIIRLHCSVITCCSVWGGMPTEFCLCERVCVWFLLTRRRGSCRQIVPRSVLSADVILA
jgi:hypothetical protein